MLPIGVQWRRGAAWDSLVSFEQGRSGDASMAMVQAGLKQHSISAGPLIVAATTNMQRMTDREMQCTLLGEWRWKRP
jgi:hypothetical protein